MHEGNDRRFEFAQAAGHDFDPFPNNLENCRRCGAHRGNHTFPLHVFVGRSDRDCEVCSAPDRAKCHSEKGHLIHGWNCIVRYKTWAANDPDKHCDCGAVSWRVKYAPQEAQDGPAEPVTELIGALRDRRIWEAARTLGAALKHFRDSQGQEIPVNSVVVTLEIDPAPLADRECSRCHGTDFRAIVHRPGTYRRQCADCTYQGGPDRYCGRVVAFTIRTASEEVLRCGDTASSEFGNEESQTVRPLAICLGCNKIVDLM